MTEEQIFDVLVIGSGAAGLNLTLELRDEGLSIAVLSKSDLSEGSTYYAQGGIAAVLDETDSIESHIQDTLVAGAGLCDPDVVRFVVENGREAIAQLTEYGVDFSREETGNNAAAYHLTREGGHSHRRVVHAADATGRVVATTLESQVRAQPGVHAFEHFMAVDLICDKKPDNSRGRVIGAYVFDIREGRVKPLSARVVVLATGGASRAYLYTSAPDGCTGDGIAMAWRAGCRVGNMEFSQFHPTCLYHPEAKNLLITEAVRGEGGKLLRPNGTRFMDDYDARGELAPRDIVARAIDSEMKRHGFDHVLLDISHHSADFILHHFPTAYRRCLEFGFDITREAIPVVPAAHYTCGGIATDIHGRTDIENLYAIGEAAYTGLHGANRMASNSLLECLVFSKAAATDIIATLPSVPPPPSIAPWDESFVTEADEEVVVSHNWDEVRRFMWDYVGIVRSDKRLARALHRCDLLKTEIDEFYGNFRVTGDLLELRNIVQVAELIVKSAISRKESRGLHYTLDYSEADETHTPRPTILIPEER